MWLTINGHWIKVRTSFGQVGSFSIKAGGSRLIHWLDRTRKMKWGLVSTKHGSIALNLYWTSITFVIRRKESGHDCNITTPIDMVVVRQIPHLKKSADFSHCEHRVYLCLLREGCELICFPKRPGSILLCVRARDCVVKSLVVYCKVGDRNQIK